MRSFLKTCTFLLFVSIVIIISSCSPASDGTNNYEYSTFCQDQYWKAEATTQGIKITFFALPEAYRNHYIELKNETDGTSAFPNNWTDKSQNWTGVYPLVEKNRNYIFHFHVSENLDILGTKDFKLKAIGGMGHVVYNISDDWMPRLTWSTTNLQLSLQDIVIPLIVSNPTCIVKFFSGQPNPWNANWIDQKEYDPAIYNITFSSTDNIYNKITNSSGKIFAQYYLNFKLIKFKNGFIFKKRNI